MRKLLFLLSLSFLWIFPLSAQDKITSIDFVQVQNDNKAEALYYYQNNWRVLRETAIKKGYIHSFQFLEVDPTEDAPFHIILITNYGNEEQFAKREDNFSELIEARGDLRLLNDKKPGEFRKILFSKEKSINLK
ncbi:MAG: hypothetical protein R8P61_17185 [Bacteroidia bacterium]|nr:hypothetical protein [Bacteroidia bacterium]